MSTYLERKRYRRTRFGIWIRGVVAIIVLVIGLVSFVYNTPKD